MKKALTKTPSAIYYFKDGVRMEGAHYLIRGDLTGIRGDLTGIFGDLTGIRGNLDDCEITEEERKNGIDIQDLIK